MNKINPVELAYRTALRKCWKCENTITIYNWPYRLKHESIISPPEPIPSSIKMQHSESKGGKYWVNTCVHCGAIQGDHFAHNVERIFRNEMVLLQRDNETTINDGRLYSIYNDIQLKEYTYWLRKIGCRDCSCKYIVIPTSYKLIDIQLNEKGCSECKERYSELLDNRKAFRDRQVDQSDSDHTITEVFGYDAHARKSIHRKMLFIVKSKKDHLLHLCSFETGEILKTSANEWELKAYPLTSMIEENTTVILKWSCFDSFKQASGVREQYNKIGFASPYPIKETEIQERFPDESISFQMDWLQYFYDYYLLSAEPRRTRESQAA